jgi:hypothetical protein
MQLQRAEIRRAEVDRPDNPDCGNGVLLNGNQVANDPNDAYVPVTSPSPSNGSRTS